MVIELQTFLSGGLGPLPNINMLAKVKRCTYAFAYAKTKKSSNGYTYFRVFKSQYISICCIYNIWNLKMNLHISHSCVVYRTT